MTHYLSKIRAEAAALYAIAHPEVKLVDIGYAIGLASRNSAISVVSTALKLMGKHRKPGAGTRLAGKSRIATQ